MNGTGSAVVKPPEGVCNLKVTVGSEYVALIIPTPFVLLTAKTSVSVLFKLPPEFMILTLLTDEPSRFATASTVVFTTSSSLLYMMISGAVRYLEPVEVIPIDFRLKLSLSVIIFGTDASGDNVESEG